MAIVAAGGRGIRWIYDSFAKGKLSVTLGQIVSGVAALFSDSGKVSFRKVYTPGPFAETDLAALDHLIARDPFITLLSHGQDGEILVSHVPILYSRSGEEILIEGHWARGNAQAKYATTAMIIVRGPHTYISASYYPDKEEKGRVPTWNYAVAHVHGRLELLHDEAEKSSIVARLSAHFEETVKSDWVFEPQREDQRRQLKGIIGFRFHVHRVDMKFKLDQNSPVGVARAIADKLDECKCGDRTEIAALMRAYAAKREAK